MTRCRLCHIVKTGDEYGICLMCRSKAAKGWATYNEWIIKLEAPPVTAVISGEPGDVDYEAMMRRKTDPAL